MWVGGIAHVRWYVEAPLDHACEQVGRGLKGSRRGAGHRQSQRAKGKSGKKGKDVESKGSKGKASPCKLRRRK